MKHAEPDRSIASRVAGSLTADPTAPYRDASPTEYAPTVDKGFGERLAAVDQIRPGAHSIRIGWLFLAGRAPADDGRTRRVFHPLVSVPVRVDRTPGFGGARLVPVGDAEITPLADAATHVGVIPHGQGRLGRLATPVISDDVLAQLGTERSFAQRIARAAGFEVSEMVAATEGPDALLRADGLRIVAGVAVYALHEVSTASRAGSLRAWADEPLLDWTAFHSLYLDVDPPAGLTAADDRRIESPLVLTPAQKEAVLQSRQEPVTVVSGAPGTGKSHTIAAIALDALARGESVLVAARADATVDALLDLLARSPGPEPIVFGSSERRAALARRLADGQMAMAHDRELRAAEREMEAAVARRDELARRIRGLLDAEALTHDLAHAEAARVDAPWLFRAENDLDAVGALLAAAREAPGRGWFARRRARRAERTLRDAAGAGDGPSIDDLAEALAVARAARTAADLVHGGGLELGTLWAELDRLDLAAKAAAGSWLSLEVRSGRRRDRRAMGAIAAVATALRAGRGARRDLLSRLGGDHLTRALPLWVGTLPDVDDLLPAVAGLFDLVIIDEASSVEQSTAAATLLRGRRAVIAGDPRQLRHVSFMSDEQTRTVLADHHLLDHPAVASRLDVRRNSCFDVAASVAPVVTLDEHFRSDPHLFDFVARRLYGGQVHVATRTPQNQSTDCIHVVRVDGARDEDRVVEAEIQWIVEEVRRHRRAGRRSVGVLTPFRAQADAIEAAMLRAFSADELEALDLRVGTVHAFQGNERDIVLASIGIGPDEPAGSWRFVDDPHLFAVMATRARQDLTIVLSADPPAGGLLADYLAQHDAPPPPPGAASVDPWAAAIAEDLAAAGLPVTAGYATGRHRVDIAVALPERSVAIEGAVHRRGSAAHIRRHLALRRTGWEVMEAYPSRWSERRGELLVELQQRLR